MQKFRRKQLWVIIASILYLVFLFKSIRLSVPDKFRLSEALRKRETASNKIEYYT